MIVEQHVCNIIQEEMGLSQNQVWLWQNKINEPTNGKLFVVLQVLTCKPFGNTTRYIATNGGMTQQQSVNMNSSVSIDIMSRSNQALIRKEEVILALGSTYAEQIQEKYGFQIGRLSTGFLNLTDADGAGMLYRFNLTIRVTYFTQKTTAVPYYDSFNTPPLLVR